MLCKLTASRCLQDVDRSLNVRYVMYHRPIIRTGRGRHGITIGPGQHDRGVVTVLESFLLYHVSQFHVSIAVPRSTPDRCSAPHRFPTIYIVHSNIQ